MPPMQTVTRYILSMLFPERGHPPAFSATFPSTRLALAIPVASVLAVLLLSVGNSNMVAFSWLNGLSQYTGDTLWANITLLGEGLLVFALMGAIIGRRPDIAWSLLVAGLMATLLIHGLKQLFDAPRPVVMLAPSEIHVIGPALRAVSFPSGHAAAISLFASTLALQINNRRIHLLLAAVVLVVATSRVVVGAHWPVDVVAGIGLGWIAALAGVWLASHARWGLTVPARAILCLLSLWAALFFWDAPTGQVLAVTLQKGVSLVAGLFGLANLLHLSVVWQREPR
jgi:membrane-associated phospholipid phosphatase